MQLDPEAFADGVIDAIDIALGPVRERIAAAEIQLKMLQAPVVEDDPDALAASFTGLLQKELTALLPTRTVKRIERNADGQIDAVVEAQE